MSVFDEERQKVSFNVNKMASNIWNGQKNVDTLKLVQDTIEKDPILQYDPSHIGSSREEWLRIMAKRTTRIHEVVGLHNSEILNYALTLTEQQPFFGIHWKMFIPAIRYLASEKQSQYWLPLATSHQIVGTYCQTELGHGSDVQNLETTAIYDKNTQEFVINSPTLSSIKWWPGDLGLTCTHVAAFCQLIVDGKKYGVQCFIVPIRDTNTFKPLPGIEVGDIGPKYGYNTKDNGFCRFTNIKVPRDNMLCRYVKVSKDGQVTREGNEKIGYATMMEIRATIVWSSPIVLSRALIIGIRYSLVRKQFKDANGQEIKVLDYQIQQDRLFPLLAECYAMYAGSQKIFQIFHEMIDKINKNNDFSLLADFHAAASGCKAVYSNTLVDGIEIIRRACGGHGYSAYSRFPDLFSEFSTFPTYEGENYVLLLQTARYLVKAYQKANKSGTLNPFVEYLLSGTNFKCEFDSVRELFSTENIRKILRQKAAALIAQAAQKLLQGVSNGLKPKECWDTYAGNDLIEAALAHIDFFTFNCFLEKIMKTTDENIKEVLNKLACLFGIQKILNKPIYLFENEFIKFDQIKLVKEAKEKLLADLRKDAIGLVDAFGFSDGSLGALGRYDGKVYETLYEWATQKNKINKQDVTESIQKEIFKIRDIKPAPKL